jgi:SAM-dependent methyltransferase
MDYEVRLDATPGQKQTEESLVVTHRDGRVERMRLHEYDRVYAIPGLYEEVVQRRLECESPRRLADALIGCAGGAGELRVFDLGAGNGVLGGELASRGVETLVGADNIPEAREAAMRDRPGLYSDYLVGDADELPEAADLVRERGLNALTCAAALGLGHITAETFARLWDAFPPGSWFAVSVHEALAEPGGSDFGDYLQDLDRGEQGGIVHRERFRHRLTMAGEPIHYLAVVARRAG